MVHSRFFCTLKSDFLKHVIFLKVYFVNESKFVIFFCISNFVYQQGVDDFYMSENQAQKNQRQRVQSFVC